MKEFIADARKYGDGHTIFNLAFWLVACVLLAQAGDGRAALLSLTGGFSQFQCLLGEIELGRYKEIAGMLSTPSKGHA
jgi:hypothetical protein